MLYHIIAFGLGFVLDLLFGDPYWLPHPIRLIGRWIGFLEKHWNRAELTNQQKLYHGAGMVITVLITTFLVSAAVLSGAYILHPLAGVVVESIMTYQILATKCLKTESMKVYHKLQAGCLKEAREAVSMIVGRDTEVLDENGVAKAAIETVAENTSDGVIAPMIYLAMGGPVFGFLYKAINTMDSMVGYKNEKFLFYGRTAAKLDDVANYVPSRISAWLMVGASFVLGLLPIYVCDQNGKRMHVYQGRRAFMIYRRDCRKHASPNSAQTEAACAGSLGIQLAGNASYFGKIVEKPLIGDAIRSVSYEDIQRANCLLYMTAGICEILLILFMSVFL
jgi:adenosylcobinamide-phosphate synthase